MKTVVEGLMWLWISFTKIEKITLMMSSEVISAWAQILQTDSKPMLQTEGGEFDR